jgi:hypothetical protein
MYNPKTVLRLTWDTYLLQRQLVEAHNKVQDEELAERGRAAYIEMPVYDDPLSMAAGGVWQRVIQVAR